MEKISLSRFRNETRHKKVVYKWLGKDGKTKEFETDKFYCNAYGKGSFKMLSMPKFNLRERISGCFRIWQNAICGGGLDETNNTV